MGTKKKAKTMKIYWLLPAALVLFALGLAVGAQYQSETFVTKKGTKVFYSTLDHKESAKPATFAPNISTDNDFDKYPGLSAALQDYDERPCPTFFEGTYRQIVLGVSSDKSQALVSHSCGSLGYDRSYMVKQDDGKWLKIGAPHEFHNRVDGDMSELLDLPSCNIVEKYNIQKSIAPICYDKQAGKSDLALGDWTNYKYTVR